MAPYAASRRLADKRRASRVPHDVILSLNSGQALNRDPELNASLGAKITEHLDTYAPLG